MVISERAQRQIDYLCETFPNTEWSGALFYKVDKEDFSISEALDENTDSCTIEVLGLFPLNLGDTATTRYRADDPELLRYISSHPEYIGSEDSEGIYLGHIHSHHTMQAFFSGTDQNELFSSASDSSIFFSLIVNNRGPYAAGFSTIVERNEVTEISETCTSWKSSGKQTKKFHKKSEPEKIILWNDTTLGTKESVTTSGEEDFDRKVKALEETKIQSVYSFPQSNKIISSQIPNYPIGYTQSYKKDNKYPEITSEAITQFLIGVIRQVPKSAVKLGNSTVYSALYLNKDRTDKTFQDGMIDYLNDTEATWWPTLYKDDTAMYEVYSKCAKTIERYTTYPATADIARVVLKVFNETLDTFSKTYVD